MRSWRTVCLLLVLLAGSAAARPHVYLVVVDGLAPSAVTPARMPRLFAVLAADAERSSLFRSARGVMPARTNPSHASLLTGTWPATHGITGNAWWSRDATDPPEGLDDAARLEVETLFTVAESADRRVATFAAFAKPKLARLFGGAPGRQQPPDTLWSPAWLPAEARRPETGYARDGETMLAALRLMVRSEPDLAVVALADVDVNGHVHGPDSPEYATAVTGADRAIGHLIDHLRMHERWGDAVLIVTSDHGFTAVDPAVGPIDFARRLAEEGIDDVRVVPDGGLAHLYAVGLAAASRELPPDVRVVLARTAAIASATPGVAEVVARLPGTGVPTLDAAHPDWHLTHERAGDLLLLAAPGRQFEGPDSLAATFHGNHGAAGDREVPLVVTGGTVALRAAPPGTPSPALVDVTPTIATLLGLRLPARLDGAGIPAAARGRPITALLADDQSPH